MIDDGCGRPLQLLPRPQRKERSRLLTVYYHISPSALRLSLLISRSDVCGVVSVSSQSFAALDWCQALAQSRPGCWMGKHTFFSPAFPFAGKKKIVRVCRRGSGKPHCPQRLPLFLALKKKKFHLTVIITEEKTPT